MNAAPLVLTMALLDCFAAFLRKENVGRLTIKKYVSDVRHFIEFGNNCIPTKELVILYMEVLKSNHKPSSINSILTSLDVFFRYCHLDNCIVDKVLIQDAPFIPAEKCLTPKEFRRLYDAADGDERTQMILKVMAGTGIRISELKFFTVEAFKNAADQAVTVYVTGKRKSRPVLVPKELGKEIVQYISDHELTSGPIFCTRSGKPLDRSNFWRTMQKLSKKADINLKKAHPHNLRRLFACAVYDMTKDITLVSALLGHSSIDTTKLYIRVTEPEMRKYIDRAAEKMFFPDRAKTGKGRKGQKDKSPEM